MRDIDPIGQMFAVVAPVRDGVRTDRGAGWADGSRALTIATTALLALSAFLR